MNLGRAYRKRCLLGQDSVLFVVYVLFIIKGFISGPRCDISMKHDTSFLAAMHETVNQK